PRAGVVLVRGASGGGGRGRGGGRGAGHTRRAPRGDLRAVPAGAGIGDRTLAGRRRRAVARAAVRRAPRRPRVGGRARGRRRLLPRLAPRRLRRAACWIWSSPTR